MCTAEVHIALIPFQNCLAPPSKPVPPVRSALSLGEGRGGRARQASASSPTLFKAGSANVQQGVFQQGPLPSTSQPLSLSVSPSLRLSLSLSLSPVALLAQVRNRSGSGVAVSFRRTAFGSRGLWDPRRPLVTFNGSSTT